MLALETLRGLDVAAASRVLAAAAFATSPSMATARPPVEAAQVEKLLAEVRTKLRIAREDRSPKTQAKLDDFLSGAIDTLFSENSASEVLKSSAHAGKLPPGMYKVVQPKRFLDQFRKLAIRERQVEEAVLQPTDFEHQMLEPGDDAESDVFSLFLKRVDGKVPHWLLVQTVRGGIEQIVQSAWRVLPNVVDLTDANSPLDVLKSFVDQFGISLKIGSKITKFIEREKIPFSKHTASEYGVSIQAKPFGEYFASWSHRPLERLDIGIVGLGYAIDLEQYRKSLAANGMA